MADQKLSQLTAESPVPDTALVYVVDLGASPFNFQATLAQIRTLSSAQVTTAIGTLGVNHGGTGAVTLAAHGVLVGNGTGAVSVTAPGTAGQVLTSNGASADPTWQAAGAGSGTVTSVSGSGGTTGLTLTGGPITTSGTLTIGGTLVVADGGTGNTTFTAYSVLCAGTTSTGVFQNVVGVGTAGQVLTSNGAAALPTWQTPGGGTLPDPVTVIHGGTGLTTLTNHALQVGAGTATPTQLGLGTSTTVLHGAAAGDPTWGAVVLTTDVSGVLPVANGGTGLATLTAHGIVVGEGTANVALVGPGATTGVPLVAQGASADPSFSATGVKIDSGFGVITADVDGATITFNLATSNLHTVTLGGNRTLAVSNGTTGQRFLLRLVQDGTGSRTVTWFSGITWLTSDGNPPTLSTAAASVTQVGFLVTGANTYDGVLIGPGTSVPALPISVANGGTGDTTLAAHGVLVGNGTGVVSVTGAGTAGQVLTSNGASADPTFQAGGAGGGGDMLIAETTAETVTTNADATLAYDVWSVFKATTGAHTATLPSPALSGGKSQFIGLRIDPASTKLVTLARAGTEKINGVAANKILWAGESVILKTNGTDWFRVGGVFIPMVATIQQTAAQSPADATIVQLNLDTSIVDNTGLMVDTTNHQIVIQRAGNYDVVGGVQYNYTAAVSAAFRTQARPSKNGSANLLAKQEMTGSTNFAGIGSHHPSPIATALGISLVAGDDIQLWTYTQTGTATQPLDVSSAANNFLSVKEVPSW